MRYIFTLAVVFSGLLSSCEKNEWERNAPEDKTLANKAFIKVYNAALSSPVVNVIVDGKKVTGAMFGYTAQFPASTTYAAIEAGPRSLAIVDTAAVPKINLSFNQNFEAGKYYTVFAYDTVTSAKFKVLDDNIVQPADTSARIRFANFLSSSVAIPNIDLYSSRLKANVFTNVPAGQATEFLNHPSKVSDTFHIRATGTTTNLTAAFVLTPDQRRSYTLLARGRYQSTTGTLTRALTVITNY